MKRKFVVAGCLMVSLLVGCGSSESGVSCQTQIDELKADMAAYEQSRVELEDRVARLEEDENVPKDDCLQSETGSMSSETTIEGVYKDGDRWYYRSLEEVKEYFRDSYDDDAEYFIYSADGTEMAHVNNGEIVYKNLDTGEEYQTGIYPALPDDIDVAGFIDYYARGKNSHEIDALLEDGVHQYIAGRETKFWPINGIANDKNQNWLWRIGSYAPGVFMGNIIPCNDVGWEAADTYIACNDDGTVEEVFNDIIAYDVSDSAERIVMLHDDVLELFICGYSSRDAKRYIAAAGVVEVREPMWDTYLFSHDDGYVYLFSRDELSDDGFDCDDFYRNPEKYFCSHPLGTGSIDEYEAEILELCEEYWAAMSDGRLFELKWPYRVMLEKYCD